MSGAFTPSPKTIRVAVIPPGVVDWQSLLKHGARKVLPRQQGNTGLSFIVPQNFPADVYGFEIEDQQRRLSSE